MYLCRVKLDVTKRQTMRVLSSPNLMHKAIEESFPGVRKRRLWRVDMLHNEQYLLVVSEDRPDLGRLSKLFGYACNENSWECKAYSKFLDSLEVDQIWYFRLCANPVRSSNKDNDKEEGRGRGKIHAHVTTEQQEKWLLDRQSKYGFLIDPESYGVTHSRWLKFRKYSGHRVAIRAVTFEGLLRIVDPTLFRKLLSEGIGRGKAYGCGLMTIARPPDV